MQEMLWFKIRAFIDIWCYLCHKHSEYDCHNCKKYVCDECCDVETIKGKEFIICKKCFEELNEK